MRKHLYIVYDSSRVNRAFFKRKAAEDHRLRATCGRCKPESSCPHYYESFTHKVSYEVGNLDAVLSQERAVLTLGTWHLPKNVAEGRKAAQDHRTLMGNRAYFQCWGGFDYDAMTEEERAITWEICKAKQQVYFDEMEKVRHLETLQDIADGLYNPDPGSPYFIGPCIKDEDGYPVPSDEIAAYSGPSLLTLEGG